MEEPLEYEEMTPEELQQWALKKNLKVDTIKALRESDAEQQEPKKDSKVQVVVKQDDSAERPVPVKALRVPEQPSAMERKLREEQHFPTRSWCEACVVGKGQERPHLRDKEKDKTNQVGKVDIDYTPISREGDDEEITVLTAGESVYGGIGTFYVRVKGAGDGYPVVALSAWMDRIGEPKLILTSDGEPAIREVREKVCQRRQKVTIPRETPKESKGSLGRGEGAHPKVQGQFRTFLYDLEKKLKKKLPMTHVVIPWLVRHIGWCHERFQPHASDGRTSYRRKYGKEYHGQFMVVGEKALFKLSGVPKHKGDAQWLPGIYVGNAEETDEILYLTPTGLGRARSGQRKPEEERWDAKFIDEVKGSPWNPVVVSNKTTAAKSVITGRSMYITAALRSEHGPTEGCNACKGQGKIHTTECKERFAKLVQEEKHEDKKIEGNVDQSTVDNQEEKKQEESFKKRNWPELGERTKLRRKTTRAEAALLAARDVGVAHPEDASMGEEEDKDYNLEERNRVFGKRLREQDADEDGAMDVLNIWDIMAMFDISQEQMKEIEDEFEGNYWIFDDKKHDENAIHKGRVGELKRLEKYKAKIDIPEKDYDGEVIDTRWVDNTEKERSRIVARNFKDGVQEGIFAGTPDSVLLRILLHLLASDRRLVACVYDAESAFLQPRLADTHTGRLLTHRLVVRPREDVRVPGILWDMQVPLYGWRGASAAWQDYQAEKYVDGFGLDRSALEPQAFNHPDRNLKLINHGDDTFAIGLREDMDDFRKWWHENFVGTDTGNASADPRDAKELKFIKREIRVVPEEGWEYEADRKHAKNLVNNLGLARSDAKAAPTPGVSADYVDAELDEIDPELDMREEKEFRSNAGTAQYMAGDRLDLRFAVKEVLRDSAKPRQSSTGKVKRIGRYVKGRSRYVNCFRWQPNRAVKGKETQKHIRAGVDADLAGERPGRKSTTCYVVRAGRHSVAEGVFTQPTVALSTAEAELSAMTRGTVEGIYVRNLLRFFAEEATLEVETDSSAAKAVTNRLGAGKKLRHVECQHFFIQSLVREGVITVTKAKGDTHPPDVGTKHMAWDRMKMLLQKLDVKILTAAGVNLLATGADAKATESKEENATSLVAWGHDGGLLRDLQRERAGGDDGDGGVLRERDDQARGERAAGEVAELRKGVLELHVLLQEAREAGGG